MNGGRSTGEVGPRVGILPDLHMSDSNKERPYGAVKQRHTFQGSKYYGNKLPSVEVGESSKISLLESRVKTVEEANYSLREDVVQLQNELKQIGTQAINFQEQRNSWSAIMDSIKASNNMISKVVSRLKEAEGMLYTEKLSVNALLDYTSQLDRVVTGHQEDMKRQKNHLEYRMVELQTVVHDIQDQRDQTEQMTLTLLNDLGQEKNKMELQDSEIKLIKTEMKQISRRMADDIKITLSSIQKQNEAQSYAEQSAMQIKTTFEHRLLQIEDAVSYFRNRQTVLESEGRILEQKINVRLNELATTIVQQDHKREEDLHKLHQIQAESNHSAESEHVNLQGKIGQLVEDLSNKLFQKEIQLREDVQKRFLDLEKNLHRLETTRSEHEKILWEESEKKWTALQKLNVEEIKAVKDQQSEFKVQEHCMKMDDNIKKLADSFAHNKNWMEKVLKAEILERDKQGTQLNNRIEDLHQRVSFALVTLQEALGTLHEDLNNEMEKAETIQLKFAESKAELNAKLEEELQNRVWDVESLRRTVGTLLADIHRVMEDTPGEIAKIKENLIVCIAEIKSLRDDLIKLKTEANLEHGNDTLPKRQLFVKGPDVTEDNEINRWGVYQAIRWLQWKKNLLKTPKFKNGRDKPLSDRKNGSA